MPYLRYTNGDVSGFVALQCSRRQIRQVGHYVCSTSMYRLRYADCEPGMTFTCQKALLVPIRKQLAPRATGMRKFKGGMPQRQGGGMPRFVRPEEGEANVAKFSRQSSTRSWKQGLKISARRSPHLANRICGKTCYSAHI